MRRFEGFFCYLVGWDDHLTIKAGVTFYRSRYRMFTNRGATLYQLHDADNPSSGLGSCALESDLGAWLGRHLTRAFDIKADATPLLGGGGGGYLECYRADDWAAYADALAACSSIMLGHGGGQCSLPMPALMHGRTHGRTYEDPHSPSLRNPLFGDARAHIRGMAVDEFGGNA